MGFFGKRVDTSDVSRIVLSFNNASGGHLFVHWLRNELMKKLGYYSQNSIYLDNVAARQFSGTNGTVFHNGLGNTADGKGIIPDKDGKKIHYSADPRFTAGMADKASVVGPNREQNFRTSPKHNYLMIGGMHDDWEAMWATALSTAKVVIQVQTQEYLDASRWAGAPCERELGRINAALDNESISVLALRFGDIPETAIGLRQGARTTPMLVHKRMLGFGEGGSVVGKSDTSYYGGGIAFQGAYRLSPSDFERVAKFCKKHGC